MDEVVSIDTSSNELGLASGARFAYDYLVLATGATHPYFGHDEWEEYAPGLKTLAQALEIRRRILAAFERAENELDAIEQAHLLNFVVVGGGPTGVELAGAAKNVAALAAAAAATQAGANVAGAAAGKVFAEIDALARARGGRPETFAGVAGAGIAVTIAVEPRPGLMATNGERLTANVLGRRHSEFLP